MSHHLIPMLIEFIPLSSLPCPRVNRLGETQRQGWPLLLPDADPSSQEVVLWSSSVNALLPKRVSLRCLCHIIRQEMRIISPSIYYTYDTINGSAPRLRCPRFIVKMSLAYNLLMSKIEIKKYLSSGVLVQLHWPVVTCWLAPFLPPQMVLSEVQIDNINKQRALSSWKCWLFPRGKRRRAIASPK